jgi:hypothetical protein
MCKAFLGVSFLLALSPNPISIPLFSHACYIPSPSYSRWLYHSKYCNVYSRCYVTTAT